MNYLILAMKRSGHHAVINWIKAHTRQKLYNNCCFGWEEKKLLTVRGMNEAINGIANIEDFNYDYWHEYDFMKFPFMLNGKVLIILRSANNWLASCYQRKYSKDEEQRDVYKYLFKNYINERKELSPSRVELYLKQMIMVKDLENNRSIVSIVFDDWFRDRAYRKYVAFKLGFDLDDEADSSIKYVAMNGKGSSFDGMKYDLEAYNMNVLGRFEQLKDDKEFQKATEKAFKILSKGVKILHG